MNAEFIVGIIIVIAGLLCIIKPAWFSGKGHGVKDEQTGQIRRMGIIVCVIGLIGIGLMLAAFYIKNLST